MRSVEKLLDRRSGWMPGVAPLRCLLVVLLVAFQSAEVVGSYSVLSLPGLWMIPPVAVAGLAALGGFLAARDRAEGGWRPFVLRRLRWVVPVYVLVIFAAVLVLGPALTEYALRDYFTEGDTYAYLLNLVAVPRDQLPGVFEFNDLAGTVNQNVWVAPLFVALLAVAAITGHRRWARAVPAALAAVVAIGALLLQALDISPGATGSFAAVALRGDGLSALVGGLTGMALFRSRRIVPVSGWLAGGAAIILAGLMVGGNADWIASAPLRVGVALIAAYLSLALALRLLPLAEAAPRAEPYLLGLFLFSFPLQQAAVGAMPGGRGFLPNLFASGAAAAILAWLFWRFAGRRLIPRADRVALDAAALPEGALAWSRRTLRERRGSMVTHVAIGTAIVLVVLGMLALVIIALQPVSEGT